MGVGGAEAVPCIAGWADEAGAMLGWPAKGVMIEGAGCVAARSRRKSRSSEEESMRFVAKGKVCSSNMTWREMMTRRVDKSRHL